MRNILMLPVLLLLQAGVSAQQQKIKYSPVILAGVMLTASEPSGQIQLIQGISYRTFGIGVGTGMDYYKYKSVPLFLDVRKNIFERPNTPFIYADAGFSYTVEKSRTGMWGKTSFDDGKYYDLGAGFNWNMKKGGSFIMSMGFTMKTVVERSTYWWSSEPFEEEIRHKLRRLSFKVGIRF